MLIRNIFQKSSNKLNRTEYCHIATGKFQIIISNICENDYKILLTAEYRVYTKVELP